MSSLKIGFVSAIRTLGKISPLLSVPPHIVFPEYVKTGKVIDMQDTPLQIQTKESAIRLRSAGLAAREALNYACSLVKPGITTDDIDRLFHEKVISLGAYPSDLLYPIGNTKFVPKSLTTSVNEIVCHGIPDNVELKDGDIVNIDVTLFKDGMHADTSKMVCVGNVKPELKKLIDVCKTALDLSIGICKPGVCISEIGKVIEDYVDSHGFSVVGDYCGHGIGEIFHANPFIVHVRNRLRMKMVPGMSFTIEPQVNFGGPDTYVREDGLTVATKDNSYSAQFEHTVMITDDGVEIVT